MLWLIVLWLGIGFCLSFHFDKPGSGLEDEEEFLLGLWREKRSRFGKEKGKWGDRGLHFAQLVIDFSWCLIGPLILSSWIRKKVYRFGVWAVPKSYV
ncbi:hypothetical protein A3B05_03175 [Candidatus Giovannonibacteria bacterium RIFCSPLOWO2_01_FULL_43_160]|uniref:Uncharacterized protein n=2 Tax=Candidatus Giovannoniibacteriota TaxID=1752738 RepID=A0A0G1L487_9BACT|nr:MAG: hypothetical protein UV72_C0005G0035 [Candidatus Giovannonibacteria bacterium GW2011_GWB1_43_13]KKS99481.1 MAG: hypothetical protein UV75_C0004G0035 [Candidatus Giovannonibacteria bacterium GW2011_GWA1_43_15]KKT21676.1 MAG: hypothetical protein UW05_C0005G0017 [Candidatus Giovannonibacteria bacterium GW2011_GWC2_43_8]KKT63402.1 MAG: hypothetical protein UW55_C0004G0035 [Candidatus Giovannonibacteria bacterium GW2011_GWA2_44_26]OGF58940.1 MAG: hypothetical protein A2652_03105 [Candidatus